MNGPLQVAIVRLRFENIQYRVLLRHEFETWPLGEDSCVVYCRKDMTPMTSPGGAYLVTVAPYYMLSDGVERTLPNHLPYSDLHTAAMMVGGMWMSSGWNA